MAARRSSPSTASTASAVAALLLAACLPAAAIEVVATTPEIVIDVGSEMGLEIGTTGRLCQSTQVGDSAVDVCPVAFRVRSTSPRDARLEVTRGASGDVRVGFEVRLDQALTRGVLLLRSNVIGDLAFLDNEPLGQTPQRLSLTPGDYSLRVEKEGHESWQRKVTAETGRVVEVWAKLEPLASADPEPLEPTDLGDDPLALVGAGAEAMERGEYEAAVSLFGRLIELRPEDPYAQKLMQEASSRLEQENQEVETASEVAYLQLALERTNLDGDLQQARSYARRLLELDPGNLAATQVLFADRDRTSTKAQAAAEEGDARRVRDIWSEFEELWSRDEFSQSMLARHLEMARQVDQAKAKQASRDAAEEGNEDNIRRIWQEYRARWPEDGSWSRERQQVDLSRAESVDRYEVGLRASELATAGDVESVETAWLAHFEAWPDDAEARSLYEKHAAAAVEVRNSKRRGLFEWALIPTGRFRYGCTREDPACEEDERKTVLTSTDAPVLMSKYETTNAQYARCVADGVCSKPRMTSIFEDPNLADRPVSYVSWFQARDFCGWLGGRLPSGVEWEFAAREFFQRIHKDGRKQLVNVSRHPEDWDASVELLSARFPWSAARPGQADSPSRAKANYIGVGGLDTYATLAPIGRFPPNSRGLYDMAGNVAEWVDDRHTNPSRDGGKRKIAPDDLVPARGGSYQSRPPEVRVSARQELKASTQDRGIGFRCVVTEPAEYETL